MRIRKISKAYCVPGKLEAETQEQRERLLEIAIGSCPEVMTMDINPKTRRLSYLSTNDEGKEVWFEVPSDMHLTKFFEL